MKPLWLGLVLVCSLCILNACGGASAAGTSQVTATHFLVTSQAQVAAGVAFNITVTAVDASNHTVTNYSGTVRFTSSDAQAALPTASRLTNGAGTFSVTFATPGSQTITATDSNSPSITGTTNPVTVLDSATFFFVTAPSNSTEGFAFDISVTATDAANRTVTSYSGTIHFTSSDGKALLPPDSTLTNGTGTFAVTLNSLGGQTITATDTNTASITATISITVVRNVATQLSVALPRSGWSPGNPLRFTVTALDAANNASASYPGTVHFTSTDPAASLPSNSTLTNGTANFSATLNTIGHQTITATDTANASITGTSRSINIAKLTISGTPPNGAVGVQYSAGTENCTQQPGFLLQASGGWAFHGLYSFSSSSLPPGLQIGKFAQNGVGPDCRPGLPPEWILYGTPTQAGTFTVIISVTDNEPVTTSTTYMITISSDAAKAAVENSLRPGEHHHYKLIDVGTLGGPDGGLFDSQKELTPNGNLVGWADTAIPNPYPGCFNFNFSPDCMIQHGFQNKDGVTTDLGALPGINGSQAEATNDNGLIVGQSENGLIDPFLGVPATDVVAWTKGKIFNLGTLGGYQGIAFDVNNTGQITGMATNTTPDEFSILGGTQSRAFLWEGGALRDLGTLGGPDSFGQFINNRGQVAGFSNTSSAQVPITGRPPFDPFIWDKKNGMRDLGNFGGTQVNPFRLNNRGELVGALSLPGEQEWHPFLWNGEKLIDLGNLSGTYGQAAWVTEAGDVVGLSYYADGEARAVLWAHENPKIKDLGTLAGNNCSIAWAANEKLQIVGFSSAQEISEGGVCFDNVSTITEIQAALWENGSVVDLNDLIPPGSGLHLVIAKDINDRGEIAGVGNPLGVPLDDGSNEAHGHDFLLIPCDENHPGIEGCDYSLVEASTAVSPRPAQNQASGHAPMGAMWQRNIRFRFPTLGPRN
jgi:probable HAF family extracellular repeat protein